MRDSDKSTLQIRFQSSCVLLMRYLHQKRAVRLRGIPGLELKINPHRHHREVEQGRVFEINTA